MLPVDHVLVREARALPAIAVVRLPNNVTHFVVAWRTHGPFVQVMDPATGRRWMTRQQFLDELYVHTFPVPAAGWREWAGSDDFLDVLRQRLARLGVPPGERTGLVEAALADPGWRWLAALDAATRMVDTIVEAGGLPRGTQASRVLRAFFERARAETPGEDETLPAEYWSVRPAPAQADAPGEEQLALRGAVLVRVHGLRRAPGRLPSEPAAGDTSSPSRLSPELAAALEEPPSRPGLELLRMLRADGVLAPASLVLAWAVGAAAVVTEALLFQGLLNISRWLGLVEQRLGALAALLIFFAASLLLQLRLTIDVLRLGRRIEARLRMAFLQKLPCLGDRYFRSRLVSDMAERSHSVHHLRDLVSLGAEMVRWTFTLVLTALGIAWLDPPSAPIAILATALAIGLPLAIQPLLAERDLRVRSHVGALGRFYLDALLGLVAIRTHGAEQAVRREHESLLVEWARARLGFYRAMVTAEALQSLLGFGLAAWLLFDHLARGGQPGSVLLLVYWALNLPVYGQEIALIVRKYPTQRNVALRLLEPLGAPEEESVPTSASRPAGETAQPAGGIAIAMDNVDVRAAGHTILEGINLAIAPGSHVAIVGPSGAGKTSLVGLLLGWHRPAAGNIRIDDVPLDAGRLEQLRRETAWVDPTVHLWNRSFLDNLCYGAAHDSSLSIGPAIEQADLVSVVERLPDGLQTPLGEGGGLLSGGEGQRVRLGRALLRPHSRLVILDEPFRGLDRQQRRELLARAPAVAGRHYLVHHARRRRDAGIRARAGDGRRAHCGGRRPGRAGRPARLALPGPAGGRSRRARAAVVGYKLAAAAAGKWTVDTKKVNRAYPDIDTLCWPAARLGEALEALARRSGLAPSQRLDPPILPDAVLHSGEEALGQWIEVAAGWLGIEAEPITSSYVEVERMVRRAGPALLRLPGTRFLALVRSGRRWVLVLGPDLATHWLDARAVRAALCSEMEAPLVEQVDRILAQAQVPQGRRPRARAAILRQRLGARHIGGGWLLRLSPGASPWQQVRSARLPRRFAAFAGAHAAQYVLWLVSWWLVGQGALQGRLERGWLLAWALLLVTLVPLRMLTAWSEGMLSIGAGGLLKRRLLYGALRLEADEIRSQGVGQLLGRVIESEAVEALVLSGGFLALIAVIELLMTMPILATGAGGWPHLALLLAWLGVTFFLGWRLFEKRSRWTASRLAMTHELVEHMVGHQTRLAQQRRERWHDSEDQALAHYLALSQSMDGTAALLMAFVSRGWLVLGPLGLAAAFVSGQAAPEALAIGLGGVISAYLALRKLVGGLAHLVGAAIAWQQVAFMFHAAARPHLRGLPDFAGTSRPPGDGPILAAHELVFRYRPRGEAVLRGCSLAIRQGERILLEGPSGGGKSTLAALLVGLRRPESGLVMLEGLDRQTLGSQGWRQRVAAAPQFHENHVLAETFAFNLLMGRSWPPGQAEWEEAEAICRELGLGEVIDRMPGGLLQMVGESGWQLSHGERSRLFIARALLQGAELVVLDESFAALDPETLRLACQCVLRRAPTLLVIAHPRASGRRSVISRQTIRLVCGVRGSAGVCTLARLNVRAITWNAPSRRLG